jgi:MFS family permease
VKASVKIPGSVWALGFVSLFMDVSSELIHSLMPIFMVTTLGVSVTSVGVVEGIAEATALLTKIVSGTLSDYLGRRKLLTLIGYGLAAATKPLFPLADSLGLVLTSRFLDRVGKGIRGAPRDALIGEIAPAEIRGACFGLRQSMDTVGAFLGPLLATLLLLAFAGNIRAVLWVAVIPAVISVAILAFGVREPEGRHSAGKVRVPIRLRELAEFGKPYWQLVAVGGVLTLGRFSQAFLILKAQAVGMPVAVVPLVMVAMNIVYAAAAYPAGVLSDRIDRMSILMIGVSFLVVAGIVLAAANNAWVVMLGVCLWGMHLGLSQGLLAAMIADGTPAERRGTAFGVFNLVSGIAMLASSVVAGMLWDSYGAGASFLTGAAFAVIALAGLAFRNGLPGRKHPT